MTTTVRSVIAIVYFVLCLLLGGASAAGAVANAILQVSAVIIILLLLWTRRATVPPDGCALTWLVGIFVGWTLLTLLPLPGSLAQSLPYRGEFAQGLRQLGVTDAAMPISLAPSATVASLLWLLPPVALFLLVVTLPADHRRRLYAATVVIAALSVSLGIFQLIGGPESSLRFYQITNQGSPVGFFANINHQATLILAALPCAAVLAGRFASRRDPSQRSGGMILITAMAIFLIAGIAIAGSVAGYGLFLPVALGSLLIYRRATSATIGVGWKIAMAALLVGFVAFSFTGPLNKQALAEKYSTDESSRRVLAERTLVAIGDTMPIGTGLGTFANVFRRYEDPLQARREFANHAHNDYVEFVLEQGAVGLILVLLFIGWWARRVSAAWRLDSTGASMARASTVIIGLVLLHSIVDYPLRTSAIAAIAALACAGMMPPPAPRRHSSGAAGDTGARHLEAA